jgi:hypothetical protein
MKIELVSPALLRHLEGFSARRVAWLRERVVREGRWKKPIALDDEHNIVLDGQHRVEVAIALGLQRVPVVRYPYASVEVWSLRPKYQFTWRDVVRHVLGGEIYPYKTVKHRFPGKAAVCDYPLAELMR